MRRLVLGTAVACIATFTTACGGGGGSADGVIRADWNFTRWQAAR